MRDIIFTLILLFFTVKALTHPWIGVIGWTWVSIMNPHKLAYGFAQSLPVAAMVGGATLIGLVITRDPRRNPFNGMTMPFALFMLWMCITLPFSIYFNESYVMWNRVMKIDLMIFVAMALIRTRQQIIYLVWVLAGSIGFYGFKGGLFTIATGGSYRVWGPDDSFVAGNNEIALATVMVIPLIRFLHDHGVKHVWAKRFMLSWMLLCAVSALGSQSRGAMLALGGMAFMLWLKSRNKLLIGAGILVAGAAMVSFMPESWSSRMNTVKSYEEDGSAMGRISAWKMAYGAAKDRVFGTGFENVKPDIYFRYGDMELLARAPRTGQGGYMQGPHSIYFEVMGEQGFIGLALFLLIWYQTWRGANQVRKAVRLHPEAAWCADLAAMCQVSLMGYLVGGAFLGLAYWDLPYNLMVVVVLLSFWIRDQGWPQEASEKPMPDTARTGRVGPAGAMR